MKSDKPIFVECDPSVIMAESKAKLESLLGRALQPAQVEQIMLQYIVYREALLTNRFNAGMRQMLYQFSTAPVLDYIAALVAVERLPASSAGCTVRFNLVEGHGYTLIPEGTRVSTSDGATIFRILDDITVPDTIHGVEVKVLAETAGRGANGYAPGVVNKILDPVAFVSTVANIDATGGGSDSESDDQLRARIKLAPSQYSSAGSRASYKFYAKSANTLITDVSINSHTPGTVLIVPLTDAIDTPEQVLVDVYAACSPEDVRPLTDTIIVSAPTRKDYTIQVDITLYEVADANSAKTGIIAALEGYAAGKTGTLGQDIIRSHIAQICRIGDVYDVDIKTPAENIVVSDEQFARCTEIVVNIIGFNHG